MNCLLYLHPLCSLNCTSASIFENCKIVINAPTIDAHMKRTGCPNFFFKRRPPFSKTKFFGHQVYINNEYECFPANSYERLFGGQVVRSSRPAQLTLFNNQSQLKQFPSKQKSQNSSCLPGTVLQF